MGTGNTPIFTRYAAGEKIKYVSFEEARKFARALNLSSTRAWIKYCKENIKTLPKNIPTQPSTIYKKKGWIGSGDFLGTENTFKFTRYAVGEKIKYASFEEARKFARSLNLPKQQAWVNYCKENIKTLPKNIPSRPGYTYKNKGWISYSDFLKKKT